ncbi:MAG: peptide deformylase [Azospirillaceae bacterium]
MAELDIVLAPDPRLKTKCRPVAAVDDRIRRLAADMLETMYAAPGIGLAAPQVGVLERLIVIDCAGRDEPAQPLKLINPELVSVSDHLVTYEEGCLSLPEQYAEVTRPGDCKVRYLDETGARREIEAHGLLAICLQHEIDHLNGVLFTDHLSALKRNMIMRKLAKWKKANGKA